MVMPKVGCAFGDNYNSRVKRTGVTKIWKRSDIQGSWGPRLEHCPAGRVSVGWFTANDYGKKVIIAPSHLLFSHHWATCLRSTYYIPGNNSPGNLLFKVEGMRFPFFIFILAIVSPSNKCDTLFIYPTHWPSFDVTLCRFSTHVQVGNGHLSNPARHFLFNKRSAQ